MGKAYSISGYLNAALRRSGRTILVEGPSDKHALHKIELEHFPTKAGASTIDHPGMLEDPQLASMGNRAKVLAIQAQISTLTVSIPKISDVLATLIDREWDGLTFVSCVPTPSWSAPSQSPGNFITVGHSIENYHFDADCAIEYLKFTFPEYLTITVLATVKDYFPGILALATALSLKVRDETCISKCSGLLNPTDIILQGDRIYLDQGFGGACASRHIPCAATIVADVNAAVDEGWTSIAESEFARWLPHGHIGDEVLWCAIAKIALIGGVPVSVANDIAHGFKKERERFKAQWLSKRSASTIEPLHCAIEWLHR